MKYSFVVPCYKSKETITLVVKEIVDTMKVHHVEDYEIICVNDYPLDDTIVTLKELSKKYRNLIVINLSKNFGQHAALLAGYHKCKGEIIISLDDDGQTPACEVFKLLEKLDTGYDVCFAKYQNKKHSRFRNLGSKLNDLMAVWLLDKPKDLYISSYFVARRYVIDEVIKYSNSFPYVTGLVLRSTAFITNACINHRNRDIGVSNYTFKSLISLWVNGFTSFSIKPLRISMILGLSCAFLGFITGIYSVINWILNPKVPLGWTSTIGIITFIGGMILIVLGMIGEYLGRIYISINKQPQYIIKEEIKNEKE